MIDRDLKFLMNEMERHVLGCGTVQLTKHDMVGMGLEAIRHLQRELERKDYKIGELEEEKF